MNKNQFYLSICILIFFTACNNHNIKSIENNEIPINKLIDHLPAADSVASILIFNAILDYGQEGVFEICKQLESEDEQRLIQVKWALSGLAIYVSGSNREAYREIYLSGLIRSLDLPLSVNDKAFIINQLQLVGGDESVPIVASYLDHPVLYEPAIQTLATIGSESASYALLIKLSNDDDIQKVAIIQALGMMNYKPAGDLIFPFLSDPNESIQKASGFALSNIGYPLAEAQLRLLSEKDDQFRIYFLILAEKMGENGDVESCLTICDEILKNEKNIYSINNRINALSLSVKYNPQGAEVLLLKSISEKNKKFQIAAIRLLKTDSISASTPDLITLAEETGPDVQSEIIEVLAKQKSERVDLYLRKMLVSPSSETRMAAINALSQRQNSELFVDIHTVLMQDSLGDRESKQLLHILLKNTNSTAIDYYKDLPVSSKILMLNILTERDKITYLPHFVESLYSSDSALRLSALKGLEILGDDSIIEELILYFLRSEDEKEKTAALRTITSIADHSTNKKGYITFILNTYDQSTVDDKILLLRVFKSIGGSEFMNFAVQEMQSHQKQIREAAVQSLADWPDPAVLDKLIDICKNNQSERLRIIATRGALRILNEHQMGDQRALSYYKDIMSTITRPEEMRLVLAGLAEIKTVSSLRLISSLLDDSNVNQEAFLAALKVSSESDIDKSDLNRDEIVVALIGSKSSEALNEKLKFYIQEYITKPLPPEGFISLFNGKNLEGWKGLVDNPVKRAQMSKDELRLAQIEADKMMKEHWHVVDGILYFDGKGSHLCTVNDYTDFELYVDWKIEKEGDSGLYLRGSPQVQIWDPTQWPEGSGGIYNNQKNPNTPLQKADNPIGEWNTFHIIMHNDKVTVYLNDVLVADNVVMENYWERGKPIYPTGQIELQSHNTPLYFKNIFIRELEPIKPPFDGDLFNSMDLTGWQVIDNSSDSWQVKDSILYTEGKGGGWISTVDEYTDFKLSLEYRLPEGGNSGVFLRAPHQGDPAYKGMEIQILDDYAKIYSNLQAWQYTGSIYGLQFPSQQVSKKSGEWQKMDIFCDGSFVKVVLNGTLIIDVNLIDFMNEERDHPGIKRRKGHIGLQNHSTKIEFRNIKIRELGD